MFLDSHLAVNYSKKFTIGHKKYFDEHRNRFTFFVYSANFQLSSRKNCFINIQLLKTIVHTLRNNYKFDMGCLVDYFALKLHPFNLIIKRRKPKHLSYTKKK